MGQGDPIRFSFNPTHWVWSLEEWDTRVPISWRGRWAIGKPSLAALDASAASGPIANVPVLTVVRRQPLSLPLTGTVTDAAYDATSDRFLLTTQHGIYLTDGSLTRLVRAAAIDPGFAVDLASFSGSAFLDSRTAIAVSENKSFVIVREAEHVDAARNFRFFVDGFDQYEEVSRGRLTTVRSRLMYSLAAAYDPASDSVLTVSFPNARTRRLVVARFDRRDMTLSEEFSPRLAPESGLTLGPKRSLDEYAVTGAFVADGILYGVSAAHSTIVAIDLGRKAVTAAWSVPGLAHPTGLTAKGDEFWIVDEAGTVTVAAR